MTKRPIHWGIFSYFLFWLIFFQFNRLFFLLYFFERYENISLYELVSILGHGMHMDASMAGYFCALPLLLVGISSFGFRLPSKVSSLFKGYSVVLISIVAILTVIDFNIYREWGTKVNYKVFELLWNSPKEAWASSLSSPWGLSLIIIFIYILMGIFFCNFFVFQYQYRFFKMVWYLKLPIILLLHILCFLFIRGSVGVAPMNPSMVYFSSKPLVNHTALNTEWFLIQSCLENSDNQHNPYIYIDQPSELLHLTEMLRNKEGSSQRQYILNMEKPNVLFIIMESFTADVVERLGGEKGVCPNFEKWIEKGLFFSNVYASGDRTYKGIVNILSGFPAQGNRNIIEENTKQEKLPSISGELAKIGYQTLFCYGGELEFANIKSYLLTHQIHTIIDKNNFDDQYLTSKWGAHDGVVFDRYLQQITQLKPPFFAGMLSLSNHEPFELPTRLKFGSKDNAASFKSTSFYADSCLNVFLVNAQKQKWYSNTLIVIIADHGSPLPKGYTNNYDYRKFRIPMLFLGGALKKEYQGKVTNIMGNQTDLAHTLLSQLHLPSSSFFWSRNLLQVSPTEQNAYVFNNGFGLFSNQDTLIYDATAKQIIQFRGMKENQQKMLDIGKAFFQLGYQQYLEY